MAAVWVPLAQAAPAPGSIERVSVSSSGEQRNKVPTGSTTSCAPTTIGKCTKRTISADGSRIVFTSRAPNLVSGDSNGASDVFLWDAVGNPQVRRVNVPDAAQGGTGTQSEGDAETPSISPNGDWIAFESAARNLVGGDNKLVSDVFVYQVSTNKLYLASVPDPAFGGQGTQANQTSFAPSVANDGSVSFTSFATNLVDSRKVSQFQNVFVRRSPAASPATMIVSQGGDGNALPAEGPSKESSISGDGLKIAFTSGAKNIAGNEAENDDDIFVATISATGLAGMVRITESVGGSFAPAISADGARVAFATEGEDTDARKDIYSSSTGSRSLKQESDCSCPPSPTGQPTDRPAVVPSIADTGAVTFQSAARYLPDVRSDHVWVNAGGAPTRASESPSAPSGGDNVSEFASISADGRFVAFTSASTNLVSGDSNGSDDVFRKNMTDGTLMRVSVGPNGLEASGFAAIPTSKPALSADGNVMAFESDSSNLVAADDNGVNDIFVRDRMSNATARVSVGPAGRQADGASRNPALSADGRYVVFESTAKNLIDGDANNEISDIFLHDRQTQETRLVSKSEFGQQGDAPSTAPSISPNGRWIAFQSLSSLATPTSPGVINVFRTEAGGGAMVVMSKQNTTPPKGVSQDSWAPSVADDGSVAFLSDAKKLPTPPDPDGVPNRTDVLVARPSGAIVKATINNNGEHADADSFEAVISGDGTKVAFATASTNLPVANSDLNPDADVYMRDLNANQTNRISVGVNGGVAEGRSYSPSINRDGSLIAFVSNAGNLVPDDQNGVEDIFLATPGGEARRMSIRPSDGAQADGGSYTPALAGNGLSVAFQSLATNLVADDTNTAFDAFVRDLTQRDIPVPCSGPCGPVPGTGGVSGLGYRFVAADGGIFNFDQSFDGSMGGNRLNRPIVGMAGTPSTAGYWLVSSDGGIFSYGDAKFFGSTGDIRLNSPIVGMTSTPTGLGYWFVAADGGIFAFGDAKFFGSMGGKPLNRPIVAMAATRTGQGYWLVSSDGGIFSYGDAKFFGSTGDIKLNRPIVGMDRSAAGNGYRFVASDGGIFSFGDAKFLGSTGDIKLNKPIVGMARSRAGDGYWFVASDGGVFSFGDAKFKGSTGDIKLNSPIVGMSS